MRLGPACNETESHYTLEFVMRNSPGQGIGRSRRLVGKTLAAALLGAGVLVGTVIAGCSAGANSSGVINAVGAENEYANVLAQVGGRYVHVSSILNNPNTDPHTFEASTSVAREVSNAQLIVQNGVGYDSFMNDIESASPNSSRKVIVAQNVLRLPDSTPNPHLWYSPKTMPAVAKVMASDLAALDPSHRAYFRAKLQAFDASLQPWFNAIAEFKSQFPHTSVATTEPVADYLLTAMGMRNLTPFVFQADIMNGVDPAPQDISLEKGFFSKRAVKLFCYNQQVVDSLTTSIRQAAQSASVPVVGVYETMPTPGYDYQSWMLAEVSAIKAAVVHRTSTEHL
jgi:zinc/manganese transport system substrate-binding protein